MYESFYELRERPFALTPDPEYLYPSRVHQEALSYLRYGIESHAGFVVITGEIGSGKTTLLQALLNGLGRDATVARLVNTMLAPQELIEAVMFDFGLDAAGSTKPAMLRALARFLVTERQASRLVLLVIDEAQNLDLPALEEIRMLSNLETEKSKLIQVILVGQPNLRDKLLRPELEQLRQRITVSYHLEALDGEETAAYINHRLRRAAIGAPLVFGRPVTDRIYSRSKGLPRLVNVICDATLVFGYAEERRVIDVDLVNEVLAELDDTGVLPPSDDRADETAAPLTVGAGAEEVARAVASDFSAANGRITTSSIRPTINDGRRTTNDQDQQPTTNNQQRPLVDLAALAALQRSESTATLQRLNEREQHLRSREQQILERERELAEQKRVLAEECRLLRERFARPMTAFASEDTPSWPPVAHTGAAVAPTATSAHRGRVATVSQEAFALPEPERLGFWRRMRAFLAGPVEG